LSFQPRLGLALTGHHLDLAEILELARLADRSAFDVLLLDGDEARVPRRPRARLYDPASLRAAALAVTRRISIGAIQLPGFTPIVQVARALATQQLASGGRTFAFLGVGSGRHVEDLGLAPWTRLASERVRALEESLQVLRLLQSDEPISFHGRFNRLRRVTCPATPHPIPLVVAAAGPRAVAIAAERADVWDANVPPLRSRLAALRRGSVSHPETWIWVFARPDASLEAGIAAYRSQCPWFRPLTEEEYREALLVGDPTGWPERVTELRRELGVTCIILDLIGLDAESCARVIQAHRDRRPN